MDNNKKRNKKRRAPYTYEVLRSFEEGNTAGSVFEAFLFSAGSVSLFRRNLRYGVNSKKKEKENSEENEKIKNRFNMMLSRLKREGLIKSDGRGKNKWCLLTKKGKTELETIHKYEKSNEDILVLVLFDIPEQLRKERRWLRGVLKELSFTMMQQSAWMGHSKIPAILLEEMRDKKIIEYVEIVQINNPGTVTIRKA